MSRRATGFSKEVLQLVLARSGGQCEALAAGCLITASDAHHRRPRGMGSTRRPETNNASACLFLCSRCHLRIESMRSWALDNGFLVRQSQNPAEVPVWWRCNWEGGRKALVLLDDVGGKRAAA